MAKYKRGNYIILLILGIVSGLLLSYFSGRFIGKTFLSDESLVTGGICGGAVLGFLCLCCLPDFLRLRNNFKMRTERKSIMVCLELLFVLLFASGLTCLIAFFISSKSELTDYFENNHLLESLFYGYDFDFWNYGDMTHGLYYSGIKTLFFLLGNHSKNVLYVNTAMVVLLCALAYYLFSNAFNRVIGILLSVGLMFSFNFYRDILKDGSISYKLIVLIAVLMVEVYCCQKQLKGKEEHRFMPIRSLIFGIVFGVLIWVDSYYIPVLVIALILDGYMTYPGTYNVKNSFLNGLIKFASAAIISCLLIFLVNLSDFKDLRNFEFTMEAVKNLYFNHFYTSAIDNGYANIILLLTLAGSVVSRIGVRSYVRKGKKEEIRRLKTLAERDKEDDLSRETITLPVAHKTEDKEVTKEPEPVKGEEPVKESETVKEPEIVREPVKEEEPVKEPEIAKEPEPIKEPESIKEPEPEKAPEVLFVRAPEVIPTSSAIKEEPVALIPNPLKGPKKHERRDFEFKYEVDEDHMNFDYEVPDSLNHYDY